MLATFARLLVRLFGWRIIGAPPELDKYLIVFAPHTSNWDLPIGYAIAKAVKLKPNWLGKHVLFRPPLGWLMRGMGGISVDRRARHNAVEQAIQAFHNRERLVLAITPEGTRKKTAHWKSGFYHIAKGAQVPMQLAFLDYRHKVGGFGPLIMPSDNIEADMQVMRDFFIGISGKYPDQAGEIQLVDATTE